MDTIKMYLGLAYEKAKDFVINTWVTNKPLFIVLSFIVVAIFVSIFNAIFVPH